MGRWQITNDKTLGVDSTVRNTSTGTRSANLVLYIYVDGLPIGTATAVITNLGAGETVPVHFSSTSAWKPGTKVLLLQTN